MIVNDFFDKGEIVLKNWMKLVLTGILVLVLAACGNDAENKPKTETEPEAVEKEDEQKKDELTAADIIKEALAVTDDQKSMHIAMDVEHNMSVPEQDFTSDTTMNIEMDLITQPFMLHQVTKTNIENEQMDLEWYATDDAFYLHSVEENLWMEMTEADKEEIIGDLVEELDHFLFLEVFEEFAKDFTVEETDAAYLVKLNASGDQFNEIMEDFVVDEMLAELEEEGEEDVEITNLNVKNVTLEFSIAKDTFFTNSFSLDLDTSLEIDGVEMISTQKTSALISKINEIENIEIPQEVIDNAIKYDEADFEEDAE